MRLIVQCRCLEDLPWHYVEKTSSCWLWKACIKSSGYGCCWWDGKVRYAHRIFYQQLKGPLIKGMHLDHLCKQRNCVNPDHLEQVTPKENLLRGDGFGAVNLRKSHCKNGHLLKGDNIYSTAKNTNGNPKRQCKTCWNVYHRAYRAKKRVYNTSCETHSTTEEDSAQIEDVFEIVRQDWNRQAEENHTS